MDAPAAEGPNSPPACTVLRPKRQTVPLVLASPHSGTWYPPAFLAQAALDRDTLRRSEDTFVDGLFADAPGLGAPLLCALYPRAYVDVNREPYELDPGMFSDPLPPYANTTSPRVAAGLGTIARLVGAGALIYRQPLPFAEARRRIEALYRPYHATLAALIAETRARFGYCVLLDCHSMPSAGPDAAVQGADVVLGDRHGLSCAAELTQVAARVLSGAGLRVARNAPYAGGYTTGHYGRPTEGVHALQIELSRRLYMDEQTHIPLASFGALRALMARVVAAVAEVAPLSLLPRPPEA
ncbi:N-formylglutamate amidohydrolase [Pararhodospirillum oryzae]|uniref:N-formylglutamate amidohydrolase n=1 Tax=Pararhodospirillum oryzae TaxID=478448 RepID=A0A512H5W5_9PROT|nr:N-formylglutamate amidohydrolase [Pararhodospirillum oryzae]GEO80865.1 N-formylglutamate amidohydrolase [Pararhodospirillum oryzae]